MKECYKIKHRCGNNFVKQSKKLFEHCKFGTSIRNSSIHFLYRSSQQLPSLSLSLSLRPLKGFLSHHSALKINTYLASRAAEKQGHHVGGGAQGMDFRGHRQEQLTKTPIVRFLKMHSVFCCRNLEWPGLPLIMIAKTELTLSCFDFPMQPCGWMLAT